MNAAEGILELVRAAVLDGRLDTDFEDLVPDLAIAAALLARRENTTAADWDFIQRTAWEVAGTITDRAATRRV